MELRELKKLLLCNAFSGLGELCGSICIWRFCVSPGSVDFGALRCGFDVGMILWCLCVCFDA